MTIVMLMSKRWKPAAGLSFSDVTIKTTRPHNHEVAKEILNRERAKEEMNQIGN